MRGTQRRADPPLAHMAQLDGLRAVAVGMVVYSHYLADWVPGIPLGRGGVLLFFVLSGFLITGILLRCRAWVAGGQSALLTLRQFYARRFLRIFPLYYAVLALAFVLGISPVRHTLLWHATYLSNVYIARRGEWHAAVSHFWSLAVEEQFYLVWPCVVLFVPPRALPWVLGLVVCAAPAVRAALIGNGFPILSARVLTPSCMDALGLGALLALLGAPDLRSRSLARLLSPAAGVVAATVAAATIVWTDGDVRGIWLDSALALISFWIVGRAAHGFAGLTGRLLGSRPAIAVGRISYGIYVIHPLTPELLGKLHVRTHPGGPAGHAFPVAVLLTALTVGLAALSWRFFEAPLNARKRRFPYRLPAVPTAARKASAAVVPAAHDGG